MFDQRNCSVCGENLQPKAALSRSTAYLDRTLLIYETVLIDQDAGEKLKNFNTVIECIECIEQLVHSSTDLLNLWK